MKKVLSFLIILAVLTSCESDVKFSNPGFQGAKDNFVWRADVSSATVESGNLIIKGYRGLEAVTLTVPAPSQPISKANPVTYTLGTGNLATASYTYEDELGVLEYVTGNDIGNGQIIINEVNFEKFTVSGSFKFNGTYQGESDIVPENVNFQEGFFYKVKLQ